MPAPGTYFTNPRPMPPTDVDAELQLTQANLNGVYPAPPPPNYPLSDSVRAYLNVADVPTVNDAIITATNAIAPPSGDQNTNGSTRYTCWGGHGYIETNVLDSYFLAGKPWPTDEYIRSVVYYTGRPPTQLPTTNPCASVETRVAALETWARGIGFKG